MEKLDDMLVRYSALYGGLAGALAEMPTEKLEEGILDSYDVYKKEESWRSGPIQIISGRAEVWLFDQKLGHKAGEIVITKGQSSYTTHEDRPAWEEYESGICIGYSRESKSVEVAHHSTNHSSKFRVGDIEMYSTSHQTFSSLFGLIMYRLKNSVKK